VELVIEQITREGVLKASRESLGLPPTPAPADDALLAALIRRAAGIHCPCSPATLIASVLDALQCVVEDRSPTEERLADLVDKLMIIGDLLELNQVTTDDPDVKNTWVFAAPPSFVSRPDGTFFLLGMAPDHVTPLPSSLGANVLYEGLLRILIPDSGQEVRGVLGELGWLELSSVSWLKAPRPETAAELRDATQRRLDEQPPSGSIADLMTLDPSRDARHYARRWVAPTDQSGSFVARRPQAHGAPLWGYAALTNGMPTRFLDFPLKGTRWRGCDVAWHLQMAIDAGRGRPQVYRRRDNAGGAYLDFFSPLPLWAARRLAILGQEAPPEDCLLRYWLPTQELAGQEGFLSERLWLRRVEHG
jgi:hypothetical protein